MTVVVTRCEQSSLFRSRERRDNNPGIQGIAPFQFGPGFHSRELHRATALQLRSTGNDSALPDTILDHLILLILAILQPPAAPIYPAENLQAQPLVIRSNRSIIIAHVAMPILLLTYIFTTEPSGGPISGKTRRINPLKNAIGCDTATKNMRRT